MFMFKINFNEVIRWKPRIIKSQPRNDLHELPDLLRLASEAKWNPQLWLNVERHLWLSHSTPCLSWCQSWLGKCIRTQVLSEYKHCEHSNGLQIPYIRPTYNQLPSRFSTLLIVSNNEFNRIKQEINDFQAINLSHYTAHCVRT